MEFILRAFFRLVLAVLLGTTAANDRKRKSDWMQQHVDFGNHLSENGPIAKVPSKDRDRRKSQGEFNARAFHVRRKSFRKMCKLSAVDR